MSWKTVILSYHKTLSVNNFKLVEQMDVRTMKYENESFDVVLDKGLLDTILVF